MTIEDKLEEMGNAVTYLQKTILTLVSTVDSLRSTPMSDQEICEYLDCTQRTLLNYRKKGDFPLRATRQTIDAWIESGHGKYKRSA